MKNTILIFTLLCFSMASYGQTELLKKEVFQNKVKINLAENLLELNSSLSTANEDVINVSNIELIDKELVISFNSQTLENGEYFLSKLQVLLDGQPIVIEPENLFGEFDKKIEFQQASQSHKILWTNLMEDYINLKGQLEITLVTEIYGTRDLPYNVDCGIKPSFTKKQKLPFIIAGVLGAGSVGAGQIFNNKSDDQYQTYLSQETFDAADPFYQDANKNAKRGEILTIAGASVLAVDAIWFFIKQRRFKKQLETYNEFCNPEKLNIQPTIGFEPSSNTINSGLTLTLNF